MKRLAEHCRRAVIESECDRWIVTLLKCTLKRPRNVLTRPHSSPLSLSSCILSRFSESASSQRSSSTKLSTHCRDVVSTIKAEKPCFVPPSSVRHDQASRMLMTTVPSCREQVELGSEYWLLIEQASTSLSVLKKNVPDDSSEHANDVIQCDMPYLDNNGPYKSYLIATSRNV